MDLFTTHMLLRPTFIFAGLDKGDLSRPGWSRGGLWSAIRARWHAPFPWGTVISPAAAASLTIMTSASACAPTCSSIGTLATTTTLFIAIILIAVLFLMLRHRFPVPWPRNRHLNFPFPTDSLGKKWWLLNEQTLVSHSHLKYMLWNVKGKYKCIWLQFRLG